MTLYILGEGKLSVRAVRDHIDNLYRVIVGKHGYAPAKPGEKIMFDHLPLRDPVIFETKDKQQAINIATAICPEGKESFEKSLE